MRVFYLVWMAACLSAVGREGYRVGETTLYTGMADASAGVAVSSNLFVAANDEDNVLRLYRTDRPGAPVREINCSRFLQVTGKSGETDLEGAARIGDRIFWITSHGRNREGKLRLNRDRFFATDIKWEGSEPRIVPVGKPYAGLLNDLLLDPRFARFGLAEGASRAPKEPGGLNIEGLAATPQGHLLIGFRNPVPGGRALLIPLLNPNDVVAGKRARLGAAIQLDLGGLGIRDIALHGGDYLIIAGSWHGGGPFRLYRWAGNQSGPEPIPVHHHWAQLNPEAAIFYTDRGWRQIQILSDDGMRPVGGVPGKEVKDPRRKTFRGLWIEQ